jgi:hypothetical protein
MKCIICNTETVDLHDKQFDQTYLRCPNCQCVFTNPSDYLNQELELDQYSRHNNSFDSPGYVDMFLRYLDFVIPKDFNGRFLDFGSGPEPVLQQVLQNKGFECDIYDPYYADSLPDKKYDFVTSTEVFEHFYDPLKEIETITKMLNKGGYLAVMTLFIKEEIDFQDWWYRRDPTHVTFYHQDTFEHIAECFGLEVVKSNDKNIILLKKR